MSVGEPGCAGAWGGSPEPAAAPLAPDQGSEALGPRGGGPELDAPRHGAYTAEHGSHCTVSGIRRQPHRGLPHEWPRIFALCRRTRRGHRCAYRCGHCVWGVGSASDSVGARAGVRVGAGCMWEGIHRAEGSLPACSAVKAVRRCAYHGNFASAPPLPTCPCVSHVMTAELTLSAAAAAGDERLG